MTKKDVETIVEILGEKCVEYIVRGKDKEKQEVERLIEVVKNTLQS